MKSGLLSILRESKDYVSGEFLSSKLGVSRAYVWKLIKALQAEGYEIEGISRKGYKLIETPDILSKDEIKSRLQTEFIGKELIYFDSTDSTNTQAKVLAEKGEADGTVVASDMQTGGKGRRGRSWIQKSGDNISMSILLRPSIEPDKASMITLIAAMAVRKAIESICDCKAGIKWPNDIVTGGKKICGILTEMSAEPGFIHYVVTGIGINVNGTEFPKEIEDTASSIYAQTGKRIQRSILIAGILKAFEEYYKIFLETGDLSFIKAEYNRNLVSLNKEVCVLDPKGEFRGISLGITNGGELLVETADEGIKEISSGEVSVRGIYGYV